MIINKIKEGNIQFVTQYLATGNDVNQGIAISEGEPGRTLLHHALTSLIDANMANERLTEGYNLSLLRTLLSEEHGQVMGDSILTSFPNYRSRLNDSIIIGKLRGIISGLKINDIKGEYDFFKKINSMLKNNQDVIWILRERDELNTSNMKNTISSMMRNYEQLLTESSYRNDYSDKINSSIIENYQHISKLLDKKDNRAITNDDFNEIESSIQNSIYITTLFIEISSILIEKTSIETNDLIDNISKNIKLIESHRKIITILISKGGSTLDHTILCSSLLSAARYGHEDVFEGIANINNMTDEINIIIDENSKKTALMLASENNNINIVEFILNSLSDKHDELQTALHAKDKDGKTALMLAAELNHTDIVTIILQTGYENRTEKNHKNALMLVSEKKESGFVRMLCLLKCHRNCQDIDNTDINNKTALMLAAEVGNAEIIRALSSQHNSVTSLNTNIQDVNGKTALMLAADNGGTEAVIALLEIPTRHDSLDMVKIEGRQDSRSFFSFADTNTALFLASRKGHYDIVINLLESDRCDGNDIQRSFLQLNVTENIIEENEDKAAEVVKLFLTKSNNSTPRNIPKDIMALASFKLISANNIVGLDVMRRHINSPYYKPEDILYIVAYKCIGDRDFYKIGINIAKNLASIYNNIANITLIAALSIKPSNAKEITEAEEEKIAKAQKVACFLLKDPLSSIININFPDRKGKTPLILASESGYPTIAQLLVTRINKDLKTLNAQDNSGKTALIRASEKGHDEIVRLLLGVNGIALNTLDRSRKTALIRASQNGNTQIVKDLISKGASLNIQDIRKKTALMHSIENNKYDTIVELLSADGIQPDIRSLKFWRTSFGLLNFTNASTESSLEINNMAKILSLFLEKSDFIFSKNISNDIVGKSLLELANRDDLGNEDKTRLIRKAEMIGNTRFSSGLYYASTSDSHSSPELLSLLTEETRKSFFIKVLTQDKPQDMLQILQNINRHDIAKDLLDIKVNDKNLLMIYLEKISESTDTICKEYTDIINHILDRNDLYTSDELNIKNSEGKTAFDFLYFTEGERNSLNQREFELMNQQRNSILINLLRNKAEPATRRLSSDIIGGALIDLVSDLNEENDETIIHTIKTFGHRALLKAFIKATTYTGLTTNIEEEISDEIPGRRCSSYGVNIFKKLLRPYSNNEYQGYTNIAFANLADRKEWKAINIILCLNKNIINAIGWWKKKTALMHIALNTDDLLKNEDHITITRNIVDNVSDEALRAVSLTESESTALIYAAKCRNKTIYEALNEISDENTKNHRDKNNSTAEYYFNLGVNAYGIYTSGRNNARRNLEARASKEYLRSEQLSLTSSRNDTRNNLESQDSEEYLRYESFSQERRPGSP